MRTTARALIIASACLAAGCVGTIVGSMDKARDKGALATFTSEKAPDAVAGCIAPAWSAIQHNLDSYEAIAQPRGAGGFTVKTLRLPDAADVFTRGKSTTVEYYNVATSPDEKWPRQRIAAIRSCL